MYYLNSRFYHPSIRRFITIDDVSSLDPLSYNVNLYNYANNNQIGNAYSPIGNSNSGSTCRNPSPAVPWLVENSTTIYGLLSSLAAGIPIFNFYWKYRRTINQEFRLYGISKWKTSLQLSNVSFKMGSLDGALIGVNVLIDMYDSYQRGVSTEEILLGGALT